MVARRGAESRLVVQRCRRASSSGAATAGPARTAAAVGFHGVKRAEEMPGHMLSEVSDWSTCEGSRRLWREPRALCVRDSPHLDRWFSPTPRATATTMPSTPTPTAGVGFGIVRSGPRRENRRPPARRAPQAMSPRHVQGSIGRPCRATLRFGSFAPPELAQRGPVLTAPRAPRLGRPQC